MHVEFTYFALVVLAAAFLVLMVMRLMRSAGKTISELRAESQRDRLQQARITRQRYVQEEALKRSSRKVNGKARPVLWDESGRRARREVNLENEIVDALASNSVRSRHMDVRAPWGWPEQKANHPLIRKPRMHRGPGALAFLKRLLTTKSTVKDSDYQSRFEKSMRHLLEDRYGRVGYQHQMSAVEWVPPKLPRELIEERKKDQIHARKLTTDEELRLREKRKVTLIDRGQESARTLNKASGN